MTDMPDVHIDDELLACLPGAWPPPAEQIRELAVVELYRRRVISSGRAAELLKMGRWEFIHHVGRLGIAHVELDEAAVAREFADGSAL